MLSCVSRLQGQFGGRQSYLSCRYELQWAERALHVWDVRFQVIEGFGDVGLELRWTLARGAGRRDLVEVSHDCGVGMKVEAVGLRFGVVGAKTIQPYASEANMAWHLLLVFVEESNLRSFKLCVNGLEVEIN